MKFLVAYEFLEKEQTAIETLPQLTTEKGRSVP